MIPFKLITKSILFATIILVSAKSLAQQDPQYTHYMHNTMTVNPAYAGQREVLSATGLFRTQWVGIDGAPQTQSLGVHSPLRNERIGLGLTIVNDALGPANEIFANTNFSYTIPLNRFDTQLSFGIKAGFHQLSTDWSKGRFQDPDRVFSENVNLFSPTIGAGAYLHSRKWYLGLSVPNFLNTRYYDDFEESIATERLHYFLIGGYVFDLSDNTKLKPAFLVKAVSGAPLIADISANALFNETFTLGLAWRWDDSFSALAGFQISEDLYIGYSYDLTSTNLNNYNSGTHEVILRFELNTSNRFLSPRFF